MEVCSCLSATMRYSQVAKAAAQEHNLAVAGAVLERLPGIAQAAAELGDDRLQMLEENGLIFTGANDSPHVNFGFPLLHEHLCLRTKPDYLPAEILSAACLLRVQETKLD